MKKIWIILIVALIILVSAWFAGKKIGMLKSAIKDT